MWNYRRTQMTLQMYTSLRLVYSVDKLEWKILSLFPLFSNLSYSFFPHLSLHLIRFIDKFNSCNFHSTFSEVSAQYETKYVHWRLEKHGTGKTPSTIALPIIRAAKDNVLSACIIFFESIHGGCW